MESVREYLIGVTAAALVCSLVVRMQSGGMIGAVIRLMAGVFMALSVASPLVSVRLDDLTGYIQQIQYSGGDYAAQGENSAREELKAIIKEQTCTYILDKARSLGASVQIDVVLTEDELPVPGSVTLTGSISPYARQELSDYISENLGIGTEAQIWILS